MSPNIALVVALIGTFLVAETMVSTAFTVFAAVIVFVGSPATFLSIGHIALRFPLVFRVLILWGAVVFLIFFIFHG